MSSRSLAGLFALVVAVIVVTVSLLSSVRGQGQAGEQSAPVAWSVESNASTQVVTNAGAAADYRIKNNGQSPVTATVTNAQGEKVAEVEIKKGETKDVGVQPTQSIVIADSSTGNQGASGTYARY